MKIPDEPSEKLALIREVMNACRASQESRKGAYRTLKQYYLYGQESGTSIDQNVFGVVNKIYPHIDKAISMLYSAETVRFAVELDESVPKSFLDMCDPLTRAVSDRWHSAECDTKFGEALRWSMVYGSMFLKTRPQKEDLHVDLVEPHHMGVEREDILGLTNQQAFFHEYRIGKNQLAYQLLVAGFPKPEIDHILAAAVESKGEFEESVTQPIDRIVTSSALPNAQGEINTYIGSRISYIAEVEPAQARMYELYVFDDDIEDWRIFTVAHPDVPVFDRPIDKAFVDDEIPFVQVCPFPMLGYFWGTVAVERLLNLQMLRNTRWDQVQHLMEMQANPAKVASGDFSSPVDEIQAAMDSPGGMAVASMPTSKIDSVKPEMPDDLFAEVNYIDTQFDDAMGTTEQMQGRGESGVRSEGHATQLLRVGSSRVKMRALVVERQIEDLATLILKIMQTYSKRTYVTEEGMQFIADQFTDEYLVRVDAHSSSPIFQQDIVNMAFSLYKAKAITREKLIDLLPVPMRDLLKMDLKVKIEPAEAKAAEEQRKLTLATGKVSPIGKASKGTP